MRVAVSFNTTGANSSTGVGTTVASVVGSGGTTYHPLTWFPTLKSGPTRFAPYYMTPGETLTGGIIDCTGQNWGVIMADNCTIDGVQIFGTNIPVFGAAVDMNSCSNSTVINCYIHSCGGDGLMCNTDGGAGQSNNTVQDCRFENCGTDSMHFKGTNGNWSSGAWIPASQRNIGHRIIGNVSVNSWQNGGADIFSYELQDGQQDMEIRNNSSDATYSLVGHVGSSQLGGSTNVIIIGNYVKPLDARNWGFELGNSRGVTLNNNTFDGSSAPVVNTGNVDQGNANNTYGPDIFINGATGVIHLAWDEGGQVVIPPDIAGGPW